MVRLLVTRVSVRPVRLVAIGTRTLFVRLVAIRIRLVKLIAIRTTTSLLPLATL